MTHVESKSDGMPLLARTPRSWALLAAERMDLFLADHAICEQQAALFALNLVAHYPDDTELVDRMTSLAAEEVVHLKRVSSLLHGRGLSLARRRPNAYVGALRKRVDNVREPNLKTDRLIVGALIEARSWERFTLLHGEIAERDAEAASMLAALGPAEKRHWRIFHRLAARGDDPAAFDDRWRAWLEYEAEVAADGGIHPTVHG
jgi:tRNA-(ms[2]io[6]A)-hydroxylase